MKTNIKAYILIVSILISGSLFAAKEYTGTVTPIVDEQQSVTGGWGIRGWVDYSAHVGQIVNPGIFDKNNDNTVQGTVLVYGDSRDFLAAVRADRYMVSADKKLLYIANNVENREKKLYPSGASSKMDVISAKNTLAEAKSQYQSDEENLIMNELAAQGNIVYSTFEGMVTSVTQLPGSDQGGSIAVEAIQLNPIGIKINGITQKEIAKITPNTPIKVYVNGIKEPLPVLNGYSILLNGTLTEVVHNYPILNGNTILAPNETPILREWGNVLSFNYNDPLSTKDLAIPETSLQKDDNGSFVWIAKGQKVMQSDKGIDYSFPIEKVYVTTSDLERPYCGQYNVVKLKNPGSLELNDLVLLNPPSGLKDGENVICPDQAYLLMPGDNVKVVIGEGNIDNTTVKE